MISGISIINSYNGLYSGKEKKYAPRLSVLEKDTVSFGSKKKYNHVQDLPVELCNIRSLITAAAQNSTKNIRFTQPYVLITRELGGIKIDKNFDFKKALKLLDCLEDRNMFLNSNKSNERHIVSMLNGISKSKYTPEEFLDTYNYFKNARTPDGEYIFESKDGRSKKDEIMTFLTNIDPGSVEASNLLMLTELVQKGVVGKHVFEFLPTDGKFLPEITEDIDKLYEAYEKGIDPADLFVPSFKSKEDAVNASKTGDIVEIKGKKSLYIKNKYNGLIRSDIDKKTYLKLFPPVERYASTQNGIGNCWELSTINSVLRDKDERSKIIGMFHLDGNDVYIKFPNGHYDEIRFKNGNLPDNAKSKFHSQGALGVQMLEYADGIEAWQDYIQRKISTLKRYAGFAKDESRLKKYIDVIKELESVSASANRKIIAGEDVTKGIKDAFPSDYDKKYGLVTTDMRNNGECSEIHNRIGYLNARIIKNSNIKEFLDKPESELKEYIMNWGSNSVVDQNLKESSGLISEHIYEIKPYETDENGQITSFKIINPWGTTSTVMTKEQLLKNGDRLYVVQKY